MPKKVTVPITPRVLEWAIESSGLTPSELAERLHVEPVRISAWLQGSERPSLTAFAKLAKTLRRPTAAFLLPSPPALSTPKVQFRALPGEPPRDPLPKERERIREVTRLQRVVAWLIDELGEGGAHLPLIRASASPANAARQMRTLLAVSTSAQLAWRSDSEALNGWRDALESLGVLVFLLPMGEGAARGFSIWEDAAPAIAANTHWRASARIFTLQHELGHLVTRTSSLCSASTSVAAAADGDGDVERWCERFAAALLVPEDALRQLLCDLVGSDRDQVTDVEVVSKIARRLRVSLRATVLRLVGLRLATWDLYAKLPPASDSKPSGGGSGGRTRPQIRIDEYGKQTTRVFLTGLERDVIDASAVMRYLDVSYPNLEELERMAW